MRMRRRAWLTPTVVLPALALILGIAAVVLAVWVLPLVLTRHPSAGMSAAARLKSQNDVRTPVIAALALISAATITAAYASRSARLTLQGQLADRYTKAIDQLGADKGVDVHIGGIYALERIAVDSARDHPTVMEVLTTYVREHSRERFPPAEADAEPPSSPSIRLIRPDVQAAVTVITRRNVRRDRQRVDLSRADLTNANLTNANLAGANLAGADLSHAYLAGADLSFRADLSSHADLGHANLSHAFLSGANLSHANLIQADLTHADLTSANLTNASLSDTHLTRASLDGADLTGAELINADLTGAHLFGTNLRGADLTQADLTGADLSNADLTRAYLTRADLTGADLTGADLTGADLTGADLTHAYLDTASWPQDASVPEGWQRDTGSGRLKRAGTATAN
jgi:uncharacterized protein YjbI with pentapeptide repeats